MIQIGFDPSETLTSAERNATGKGWAAGKGRKKSHDLRALRMQKWSARYGEAMAKIWQRHEVQGVSRNYLGRISMALVLRKRPLGMAE